LRLHELGGVSFLLKVEMRGGGMLKKMNKQVSCEDQKSGIRATQMDTLRHHLDQRSRQHETRAERDEVAEVGALPMLLNNDGAAKHVRARRGQPQQQTGQDGRHEEEEYQEAVASGQWPVVSELRLRLAPPASAAPHEFPA